MKTATASWTTSRTIGLLALGATLAAPVRAELSAEELAKMAQNPVANLISVPFQDNVNFNVGPEPDDGADWALRLQVQFMFPK